MMIKRDERASDTSLLFYPLLGQFFFSFTCCVGVLSEI